MSKQLTIKGYFNSQAVQEKFKEILKDKAPGFISSVLQVTTQSKLLKKADPVSIYSAAMTAASLDLPINQNLGFAWIVPYGNKAQFQMGWKGYVQLAQRSEKYKSINVIEVHENQFESFNSLTEDLKADFSKDGNGVVVGYCAYFKLINGFEKTVFWSKEKCEAHGKRYSKSFNSGPWKTDFDSMSKKTVLKNALSKWGPMSIEMQKAIQYDQSSVTKIEGDADGDLIEYPDAQDAEIVSEVDEQTFSQMIQGIQSGDVTLEQIKENYSLSEDQELHLESVESKNN